MSTTAITISTLQSSLAAAQGSPASTHPASERATNSATITASASTLTSSTAAPRSSFPVPPSASPGRIDDNAARKAEFANYDHIERPSDIKGVRRGELEEWGYFG